MKSKQEIRQKTVVRGQKTENAKMEIRKITGKPAYAKASADNTAHRSFNAGGASSLTTRLEASSVVYLCINFVISIFCFEERIT